ncbi:MAG: hypothetical protein Kow0037_32280 [Calditrichia bacterium]
MNKKSTILKTGILFCLFLALLIFCSCDEKEILEPGGPQLPPLTDPIPYEALISGTIVFERIGPYPGEYSGWYVIDVGKRKNWSLGFKVPVALQAVSPDGEKILFSANSIYVMNIFGSDVQKLTENEFGGFASWAPDGSKIYFRQKYPERLYSQSPVPRANDLQLIHQFTVSIGGQEYYNYPSGAVTVSPNGKIAYVCNVNRQHGLAGLYIMDSDGSNLELILALPEDRNFDSPVFSKDGQKIYFLSVEKDAAYAYKGIDVVKVKTDGSHFETILSLAASGSKEWADGKLNSVYLALSPDDSKFLLNLPEGDFVSHLYVLNNDGSNLTQVTFAEGVTDRCVSWGN